MWSQWRREGVVARARPRARITCAVQRDVTVFATGQKLVVAPARYAAVEGLEEPKFVVCPACASAYVGNAVVVPVEVKCARCSEVFTAEPGLLFSPLSKEALERRKGKGKRVKERAPAGPNEIRCEHFSECPGCSLDRAVDEPPVVSTARNFMKNAFKHAPGFDSVKMQAAVEWRTHAKLAVRLAGSSEMPQPTLGLFKARSHDLVSIPRCAVHSPAINAATAAVQRALKEGGATCYNDFSGDGMCRYVLFTVQRVTGLVQVTFVWNSSSWKDSTPVSQRVGAALWRAQGGKLIHSIWFNWNTSAGNAIVAPDAKRYYHMYGPRDFVDRVMDVDIHFPPYAFRQANLDAFEKLLMPELLRHIPLGSSVAEFCAGVGVIGLIALKQRKLRYLIASEINAGAQDAFRKSLQGMKSATRDSVVEYRVGSDSVTADIADQDVEVVIVDPPRAGLSEFLMKRLSRPPPGSMLRRIIYVSCGFEAFRRDTGVLAVNGWTVASCHAYILFPGSNHVEILAVFDRPKLTRADDTISGDWIGAPPERTRTESDASKRSFTPESGNRTSLKRSKRKRW